MCILVFLFIFTSISYGNISFMGHRLLHDNKNFVQIRNVAYTYDQLNRLIKTDDFEQGYFDESFAYDALGRIVAQRRDTSIAKNAGGEYAYHANTNRLKSIANGMGGTADDRNMSDANNFVYDSEGNLIEDKSKKMRITYDWRGMPVEFVKENFCFDIHETIACDSTKLLMAYDGSGKRISKILLHEKGNGIWETEYETHYTGIGTEIRTSNNGSGNETKVVVNMPQSLGRYGVGLANYPDTSELAFEWYLKNHLGSTMAVYRTTVTTAGPPELKYAYDYRSYGEKVNLAEGTDKVTENFTGKELDDETKLSYHEARFFDPILGIWLSIDLNRYFPSPYVYMGNGYNSIKFADLNGKEPGDVYLFYSDGSTISNIITFFKPKYMSGYSHAAVEAKNGQLFSATGAGVGTMPKSEALNGRTGIIMRPRGNLDVDAMQSFINKAEGGIYIINGVCSSNVVEALKAGGINLEETWTIQDFFDNPLETIDKMIPHPSNLSENPQLEKIGEFGSDVE